MAHSILSSLLVPHAMSDITRTINHRILERVTLHGTYNEDGERVVLDVEKGGDTIPRDAWMGDFHDELAERLPRFEEGDAVRVADTHPTPEHRGHVGYVQTMYDTGADKRPSYTITGVTGTVSGRHLFPAAIDPDELREHLEAIEEQLMAVPNQTRHVRGTLDVVRGALASDNPLRQLRIAYVAGQDGAPSAELEPRHAEAAQRILVQLGLESVIPGRSTGQAS